MRGGLLFPFLLGLVAGGVLVWALGSGGEPARTTNGTRSAADRRAEDPVGAAAGDAPAADGEAEPDPNRPKIWMSTELADALGDLEKTKWDKNEHSVTGLLSIARLYALAGRDRDTRRVLGRVLAAGAKPQRVLYVVSLLPPGMVGRTLDRLLADHPDAKWKVANVVAMYVDSGARERGLTVLRAAIRNKTGDIDRLARQFVGYDPAQAYAFLRAYLNDPEWNASRLTSIAKGFVKQKHAEAALPFLFRALELEPGRGNALTALAKLDPAAALRFAERRVEKAPTDGDGWVVLAKMRKEAGDNSGAFEAYREAMKHKDDEDLYWELFQIDRARALPIVQKMVQGTKNDEKIGMMADIYREYGMEAEALEEYMRAHENDPTDSEWLRGITRINPEKAVELLSKKYEEQGDALGDEVIGAYANALMKVGQKKKAFDLYKIAMEKDDDDNEWLRGIADSDPERAIPLLRDGVTAKPNDRDRVGALATALANHGARTEALKYFRQATADDEGRSWFVPMARVAPKEAVAGVRARIAKSPENDEDWGTLGKVYMEIGNLAEARTALLRAKELDPGDSEWTNKLKELDQRR